MKEINIGIIGAGWVTRKHLEVIRDISYIKVNGITSRTKSKAEELAKEFNIPECCDNLNSLFKKTKLDALMVLVSSDQIYDVCVDAMNYGVPLFIEKPAGISPDENLKLVKLARKKSILNMVGFNRRFYSIFHKGIDIIKKHGDLFGIYVEGHERMWKVRQDSKIKENILDNWFFANSIHCVDLLRFFGGEATVVKNIVHRVFEKRFDQIAAVMEMDSGAIGQYSAHWYSPGGWKVVLYGNGVTVEFKPLEKGIWIDKDFNVREIKPDEIDSKYKVGFFRQIEAFAKLISEKKKVWPSVDLEESLKTALLAKKISTII